MHITIDVTEGVLVLHGRVDVLSVGELRESLHTAVDAGVGDLVVDVSDIELVDAAGLGAMLSAHRRARRAGRRLVLRGVGPDLHRLFHRTRLNRILTVETAVIPLRRDPTS